MRVAGPCVYALRHGSDVGGEVYERMLLERLPAHGVELVLGLPRRHGAGDLAGPGVRIDMLRHGARLHWVLAPLVFVPWTLGRLARGELDLLRAHSVRHAGPSLLIARALARSRTPVVIHHHHFFPRWAWLEARILRRAELVITVSEHSRAALERAGVEPGRIRVVLDGVAGPPPTGGWREAWPGPGLRLLELGRLEPRKRPELGIATLVQLRARGIEASLVIAGDGPMAGAMAAAARAAGVGELVRLTGRVSEDDKWRLLDTADVLLFGSTLEGFGLVVAEAQSRGVPVVAAGGSASAEALDPGRSGLLVAPEPAAFAAAAAELLDPERRAAMARAARAHAARFDWDACAAGVAAAYRAAAGR